MADPRFAPDAPENDDDELNKRLLMLQMQQQAPSEDPAAPPTDVETPPDMPEILPDPVADTAPPTTSSVFQSHHGTVPGYLQAAMSAYAPTVQGAKSEQEAKRLAQDYITSLRPEIEKRGGVVGDIKNEKVMIDGKWVDLYRDIGGASEAQYLVDDGMGGGGGGGDVPALMSAEGSALTPTSLPTDASTYQELMKRIQEILGPEAVDRQALLTQMKA